MGAGVEQISTTCVYLYGYSIMSTLYEDLRGAASRVENEVLIVEGNKDTTTPKKEAEAYLAAFPNGKLKFIDGGHFAFAENPLAFNLLAEEFFYD